MSFLPILARELRVAARRPSTYRARTAFVAATSGLTALLLLIGVNQVSNTLFSTLATLAFGYCWLAGVRQASDCLSEEKREGTLGLLFLTDLRGYDVVLGKLGALATRSFQGLFAILPVLSVGLLLGGLTQGEFWRTAVVLSNTLFFTLCVGLLVSTLSRASHWALVSTLTVLLFLSLAPLLAETLSATFWPSASRAMNLIAGISPAAALPLVSDVPYRSHAGQFWTVLLVNHLAAWGCLIWASWALPRVWQDPELRSRQKAQPVPSSGRSSSQPSPVRNGQLRRRLLDINPIFWLAARHDGERFLAAIFCAAVVVAGTLILPFGWVFGSGAFGLGSLLSFGFGLVLKLWVGWRACATLAEARRNGAVELLLATPVGVPDIISGQWLALRRYFLWPCILVVLLGILPSVQALLRQQQTTPGFSWVFPIPLIALFGIATFILDLVAVASVGMWMGLTEKGLMSAFAKTVLYVTIVPTVLFCIPNLLFDLFWITWARRKLEHQFRQSATEASSPGAATQGWTGARPTQLEAPPLIANSSQSNVP